MDIKINVTADCEGLLGRLPTGYSMELLDENYGDAPDFSNNWVLIAVDDDFPEHRLEGLAGVISYEILD